MEINNSKELLSEYIEFDREGKLYYIELHQEKEDICIIADQETDKISNDKFMLYKLIAHGLEKDFYTYDIIEDYIPDILTYYIMYQTAKKELYQFKHVESNKDIEIFDTGTKILYVEGSKYSSELGIINNRMAILVSEEDYISKDMFQLTKESKKRYFLIDQDNMFTMDYDRGDLFRFSNDNYILQPYFKDYKLNGIYDITSIDKINYTDIQGGNLKNITYRLDKWGFPESMESSDANIPFYRMEASEQSGRIVFYFSYLVPFIYDITKGIKLWNLEKDMILRSGYFVLKDNIIREINSCYKIIEF